MSEIKQIERAVTELPPEELAEFRNWFLEYDAEIWDRQIEEDVKSGKLDELT